MGGIGAGCCFGLGTPARISERICSTVPSTLIQIESRRFGAMVVPCAFGPWQFTQLPFPSKICFPRRVCWAAAGTAASDRHAIVKAIRVTMPETLQS